MSENATPEKRARARDLGIQIGRLTPGPHNSITDVAGVRVGHTTLIAGEGPLVVGQGPVRTGVTVILPRAGDVGAEPVFAGFHILNGNGEMTGLPWLEEAGLLATPVAITNTHSVGVVRDALIEYNVQHGVGNVEATWSLPVVAETYDGFLNDINGFHVRPEHVFAALDNATSGPVAEGNGGGGTGMMAHGFKGGIGTSSRVVPPPSLTPAPSPTGGEESATAWTVGVLVQANYGQRARLTVDGVPVGREIPPSEVPLPWMPPPAGAGSIIVVVATDAPLLPGQLQRLARRAPLGIGRTGGLGSNGDGDLIISFSTANPGASQRSGVTQVNMLANDAMDEVMLATVQATEEAIVNALVAAETMTGRDGNVFHALPQDRLRAVLKKYNRLRS